MFDKQVHALTTILKDKDIQQYAGEAFGVSLKQLF